jgi:hypothetical protein
LKGDCRRPSSMSSQMLPCSGGCLMNSLHEQPWTLEAVQLLVLMAKDQVPVPVISLKLKRPISEVHAKLLELGLAPPPSA